MCQVRAIILVAWFAQAHATEPVAQNIINMQDPTGTMIDHLADMFIDRALKARSLRGSDLDDTTFAKMSPQTIPTLNAKPLLPVHGSSFPVSQSMFPVATSFVPVLHNSLQIPRSLAISRAFPKGFVKEGNRKDKVARRKKREIMTKARYMEQQIADELVEIEQLLHNQQATNFTW